MALSWRPETSAPCSIGARLGINTQGQQGRPVIRFVFVSLGPCTTVTVHSKLASSGILTTLLHETSGRSNRESKNQAPAHSRGAP